MSCLGTAKMLSNNDFAVNGNRARTGPALPPPRPPARTCSFSSVTSPTPPPPPPAAAHQSLLARLLPSPRPKLPIDQHQQQTSLAEDPHEQTVPTIMHQQPLRDRPRSINPEARLSTFSKKQPPLAATTPLPNSLSTTTFLPHNQSSSGNGIEPLQNVVCDSVQRPTLPSKPNRDGSIKQKSNKKSAK